MIRWCDDRVSYTPVPQCTLILRIISHPHSRHIVADTNKHRLTGECSIELSAMQNIFSEALSRNCENK